MGTVIVEVVKMKRNVTTGSAVTGDSSARLTRSAFAVHKFVMVVMIVDQETGQAVIK